MGDTFFGLHYGHLTQEAADIASFHGAYHVNYKEPGGQQRGWFGGPNCGAPFDQQLAAAVMADIDDAGGIEALLITAD